MRIENLDVKAMAGLLAVAGLGHLVRPAPFESIVPKVLPHKRELVYLSGVAELACAAALIHPRTRVVGGWATAVLMAGVFPANVSMAVAVNRRRRAPTWLKIGTIARLPLQVPLVRTGLKAARGGPYAR